MKKLLAILIIFCSCSVAICANCEIPGWEIGSNFVRYVALAPYRCCSCCSCRAYLGWYTYSGGEWHQEFCPQGGSYIITDYSCQPLCGSCSPSCWDGNLDDNYSSCDNAQALLNEAYLAKDIIDSNDLVDYLNNNFPGGPSDPSFESDFLAVVEMDNPETQSQPPPYENPTGSAEAGEPVFMSNGEHGLSVTDVFIQGRGLSAEIVRTYGSRRDYNSRFGFGWDMNYNMKVRKLVPIAGEPNTVILLDGRGHRREYLQDAEDPNLYERQTDKNDYLHDANNTLTLKEKSGIEYNFDINGNLSTIKDENSNQITFTYNSNGLMPIYGPSRYFDEDPNGRYGLVAKEYQLQTITDSLGRQINLYYDPNGLLRDVNDFADRNWHYSYNHSTNDLLSVKDPNGLTTQYSYDHIHNLLSITDPNGQVYLTSDYQILDYTVKSQVYGDGTFTFDYDLTNREATITDREGFVTKMTYSSYGQVLSETIYTKDANSEPNSFTTDYLYNSNLELSRVILPAGNCTSFVYNDAANVTHIYKKIAPGEPNDANDPNVIAVIYTYDPNFVNKVKTIRDPNGNITTFEYDSKGNVKKITYPAVDGQTPAIRYTYNQYGQVETVTAPDGIITKYIYYTGQTSDPNYGKLWKVVVDANEADPNRLEITTEYRYDIVGNVIEIKDPNGDVTKLEYGKLDQLTKTTSPLNYVTNFTYNKNRKLSKLEKVKTGGSQITRYSYDKLDHLKAVTDPLNNVTTFGYNKNEDPNLVKDAENNKTVKQYDERGLLAKVTDANGGVTEYTYNANGDINDLKDAKGNVTSYEYDGFDRLVKITYPDDSNEIFTYDKNSSIVSKKNRSGDIIEYQYDALGRMTVKNRPDDPNIYLSYDIAGQVTDVNDTRTLSNGGGLTHYDYDRIGRVSEVNDPENRLVKYEYNSRGLRTKLTYPDDSNVTYKYDSLSRLTEIKYNGSVVSSYAYDELSRRKLLTLHNDTDVNAVYEYDIGNRLTKLTNNLDGNDSIVFQYSSYDKVGNRKNMLVDGNESKYYYDKLYQLVFADYPAAWSVADVNYYYDALGSRTSTYNGSTTTYNRNNLNQYTSVGGTNYSYDDNGNLTNDGTYIYTYDVENRLIDVNDANGNIAEYKYDYSGRRVSKTVGGTITKYCYDGDQIIAEYDGNDTLLRKFIYGPGIDEPVCMIDVVGGDKVYYYHFDGLGSVRALSDANGVVAETYSYDVFGEPNRISSIGNSYLFTGREYDTETGNYYYRARHYKPSIGRFLQTDTIGYSDGLNLYTYVGNNPPTYVDPLGLWRSPEHKQLLLLAMRRSGFTQEQIDRAVNSDINVDRMSNQTKENYPEHYMPNTQKEAERHINERLKTAVSQVNLGNYDAAIEILGEGAHTVGDRWSHYEQNAGWGIDCDNPNNHMREYIEAYKATKVYIDDFFNRLEIEKHNYEGNPNNIERFLKGFENKNKNCKGSKK